MVNFGVESFVDFFCPFSPGQLKHSPEYSPPHGRPIVCSAGAGRSCALPIRVPKVLDKKSCAHGPEWVLEEGPWGIARLQFHIGYATKLHPCGQKFAVQRCLPQTCGRTSNPSPSCLQPAGVLPGSGGGGASCQPESSLIWFSRQGPAAADAPGGGGNPCGRRASGTSPLRRWLAACTRLRATPI